MLNEDMSMRSLASAMDERGGKVDQSTIWYWMHSETGYPAPRSLTPIRLQALADALQLQEADIRKALDESRAIYTGKPELTPRPSLDGLATLQSVLEQSRNTLVKRTWVLHLVKALRAGAQTLPDPKR